MAKSKTVSANRKSAQKEAAKKRPQTWKPGQSGNPKGSPRLGESWAELIKRVGDMTAPEVAARSLEMAKQFIKLGDDGLTLKEAVVIRVFGSLLFEPQPGLLNSFMERTEGKVKQPFSLEEKELENAIDTELARVAASRQATDVGEVEGSDGQQ